MTDMQIEEQSPSVYINGSGVIQLHLQNGHLKEIKSPWSDRSNPLTLNRIMDGGWIYCSTCLARDSTHLEIYFVSVHDLTRQIIWLISFSGEYISQKALCYTLSDINSHSRNALHRNTHRHLTPILSASNNDLEIYQFYNFILGSKACGRELMSSYMPDGDEMYVQTSSNSRTHVLVIYNHNYARNVAALDRIYSSRFASVIHVLPNVAPPHPRCISMPYGSYDYHIAVHAGLRSLQEKISIDDVVLVLQDDVLLHPHLSEELVSRWFNDGESCCAHPTGLRIKNDPVDEWFWNNRIVSACRNTNDPLTGTGFESLPILYTPESLTRGVSDIFALRSDAISEFLDVIGYFISRSVFPEVSIPTSLKLVCERSSKKCLPLDGIYLWGEDRKLAEQDNWVNENLIESSFYFLHPVKISRQVLFT